MEETVCNPQKGRLETIQVEYTKKNTTWFDEYTNNQDICSVTDFEGGLLIKEYDYGYPVWVYDVSRTEVDNNQKKAKEIRTQCIDEYK